MAVRAGEPGLAPAGATYQLPGPRPDVGRRTLMKTWMKIRMLKRA